MSMDVYMRDEYVGQNRKLVKRIGIESGRTGL